MTFLDGDDGSIPTFGFPRIIVRGVRRRVRSNFFHGDNPRVGCHSGREIPLAAFLLAGLILAKNVAIATPSDRQRWGFIAIGTLLSFVAYAIYFVPEVPFAVGQVSALRLC